MARINYYLRGTSAKGSRVVLSLTIAGVQLFYPTGLHAGRNWNARRQCFSNCENAMEFNARLEWLGRIASEVEADAVLSGRRYTQREFTQEMDLRSGKRKEDVSLLGFADRFIAEAPSRTNRAGERIKDGTIRRYKATRALLADYEKYRRERIMLHSVDAAFMEGFSAWLTDVRRYSANYIGKTLRITLLFLNEARDAGIAVGDGCNAVKVVSERAENVVLTDGEVGRLLRCDLSKNRRLENVRDLFLIGVYTGLRFSDFSTLTRENIGADTIRVHQRKTGGLVVIPLHPDLLGVLERRNWEMPRAISNTTFNRYIKELCQIVGINGSVEIKKTVGGERVVRICEKWQLVSAHTARRTFATSLYLKGVAPQTIMQFTGHTTLAAFLSYIVVTPEQQADIVRRAWESGL